MESKIEIKVGNISFAGQGESSWLSQQMEKVFQRIPELVRVVPQPETAPDTVSGKATSGNKATGPLATYLKSKNATTNQNRKFLATAVWLHDAGGKHRVNTAAVSKALKDSNQGRLGNASECLNQNVAKGFCDKYGKEFFVTDEGRGELK